MACCGDFFSGPSVPRMLFPFVLSVDEPVTPPLLKLHRVGLLARAGESGGSGTRGTFADAASVDFILVQASNCYVSAQFDLRSLLSRSPLKHKPLHVIASGVASEKAVVLTSKGGHFKTLRELTECMRASMLLPGITGPMVSGWMDGGGRV